MTEKRNPSASQDATQTVPEPVKPGPSKKNPFSIESIRLSQNFAEMFGGKKVVVDVPVMKPPPQSFIRVRPGPGWRVDAALLELREDRELYLVAEELREELADEIKPATLLMCVDRQASLFLWPIRLPDATGRDNRFWQSARDIAVIAERRWVRVKANGKAYDAFGAGKEADEIQPEWPDLTFEEVLAIAFKHYLIDTIDHPVVRRLRWRS